MIDREKIRQLGRAVKRPFQLLRCIVVCKQAPAEYDTNVFRWKCSKCGCDWGERQ